MTPRKHDRPAEGWLIEDARKARRLSQNEAAKRVPLSGTRWRQIVYGEATAEGGIRVPVRGSAETLAKMAAVVGVTPEELEKTGRGDAAAELRKLSERSDVAPDDLETLMQDPEARAALRTIIRRIRGEEPPRPPTVARKRDEEAG